MRLRSKYFTYPVISAENDSYSDCIFNTDVSHEMDGYNVKLKFAIEFNNKELLDMIENGDAEYVHHIECSQTCYRTSISTKSREMEYLIHNSNVNGKIEVCSFIIARSDLNKYSNSQFSSDYKGFKFDIEKGCILAVGNEFELRINKVKDDLINTSSIFSIAPNLDEMITDIKVNTLGEKITILLPNRTYGFYNNMKSFMDIQPVMHSMIIIPALMQVFNELKASRSQLYEYENRRWYRGLRKTCNKMGIQFDYEGLDNIQSLEVAQKLLDTPIGKSFDYLMNGGFNYED
ncbi:hypothetical protein [Fusibacter sp. JL216-2]|uniref:hypothetical protein n=1 Tax=Fusibacter sp. JL216-2 TaxID=3071453 RepID=UPI003D3534FB